MADDTLTPPPAQTPPDAIPEAGSPEARAQASEARAAPRRTGAEFVGLFVITALTLAFFLAVFFAFPGLDGGSSDKTARLDSSRNALRAQDSLDAAGLQRYDAVRDDSGAVRGYTMPIDTAMARLARTAGTAAGSDSLFPLR